jgi:hypothetical protein
MFYYISSFFGGIVDRFFYSIHHMNVTQWGIVAILAVFVGFLALKTKIYSVSPGHNLAAKILPRKFSRGTAALDNADVPNRRLCSILTQSVNQTDSTPTRYGSRAFQSAKRSIRSTSDAWYP